MFAPQVRECNERLSLDGTGGARWRRVVGALGCVRRRCPDVRPGHRRVQHEAWVLIAMMTAPFTIGEMSRRIERDDRVHIEYVPTQVVTEFISWTLHKI